MTEGAVTRFVETSLSYRAARRTYRWMAAAARHSLVGRFFLALVKVLGPVLGDSLLFGTSRVASRRLGRGHPVSVSAISLPYLGLRRALGGGAPGRMLKAGGAGVAGSRFAGGAWVAVVGAGVLGLGCGRLALESTAPGRGLAAPVILILLGALVVMAGSRLVPAFRTSLVGRGVGLVAGSGRTGPRAPGAPVPAAAPWRVLVGAAAVLAAAAGTVAGLTPGSAPVVLVAAVAAACLLVLALVRSEVVLLAVAAFPWLDWVARRTLGGFGSAWDDALVLLSVVLLLWCVLVLRRWELWTVPIALPALLALAAALGSVVVRGVSGDVALFALRVLFQPLLYYFLGFLFPKDKRWVRWTIAVFLVAGVALALHGLYQYATRAPMPTRWVDVHETEIGTRAYSIIENPNGLGAFLLLGTLVSLGLALSRGLRSLHRLALAAVCVIHLGGVAVTFSRGAWLGLAAGTVALLIMAYRKYLTPLVAAGVVGWFVMPQAFVDRLTFAFSSTYIAKSMVAGRLYVWKLSLQHIAAHPWFGVGLGTFGGTSAVTFGYGRFWVDNFYLQLAGEGGLLLFAFFLWTLLRAAKGLVKGSGTTRDPFSRALAAGVFGGFIAVAAANVTASVWETLVVGVGFWFLAGLATSAALHEPMAESAVEASGDSGPGVACEPGRVERGAFSEGGEH